MARSKRRACTIEVMMGDFWGLFHAEPDALVADRWVIYCVEADNGHPNWRQRLVGAVRREGKRYRGYVRLCGRLVQEETRALTTMQAAVEAMAEMGFGLYDPFQTRIYEARGRLVAAADDAAECGFTTRWEPAGSPGKS